MIPERKYASGIALRTALEERILRSEPTSAASFDKVPEIVFGYDRAKDHRCQEGSANLEKVV
jgi:hypothetical protein